ncbi:MULTISPECIES: glutathione S-transferase N-terminal domain-containing protein [Sphingobium]|uniref:glutathione S-transferase N-terminal domain-containing protein n=1 Tax=Sphingobium sp. MI1205 TaxID=407020 RepID=UPI0007700D24|nr:glutathione S-transferase N-terminal domain-containing protein [Sphingobium sp. MI1205]AMK19907.1 glutathione S-transferase [Sphingobium sp. MI1205]
MIDVYGPESPNVIKVLLILQELGMAYERKPLDIMSGEQFSPEFLAISPNNKIPAIVDHDPADGGPPLSLFESGAILIYLAEKGGALLPTEPRPRSTVLAWLMWQMAGQGPMLGQAGHFRNYAPEPNPYGVRRYSDEAARLYGVLDRRLEGREWIADAFSIADIACWPWTLFRAHHGIELTDYPHVNRWFAAMEARPAFGRALPDFQAPLPITPDDETRRILFNIKD